MAKPKAVIRYKRNYGAGKSINFVEYEYGGDRYITGTVVWDTDRSLGWYFGKGSEGLKEANKIALLSDEDFAKAEDSPQYSWAKVSKSLNHQGTPKPTKPEGKEPWQMTREDYLSMREQQLVSSKAQKPEMYYGNLKGEESRRLWTSTMSGYHKEHIEKALSEGKPVPAEVLKDYPELGKKETPRLTKLTDQLDKLPGIEKTYWKGDTSTLTVYYDQATGKDTANIRVQNYLKENQLRDSVETIKLISTPKGTFKPEPKAETKGKGQQRAKYNRGSWADAVRAAKALKADHNLYLFPSHGGIKIEKQAPPFGLQHIIVKPDGTHQTVSASSSFEAGRKAEDTKAKAKAKPRKEIAALKAKPTKQSDRAIAIDRSLLAKQVVAVDDPRWLKRPNRFDVRGVDTPGSNHKLGRYSDKRGARMSRRHHRGFRPVSRIIK